MSEAERSEPGALIAGRYRLGEAIGHGGMATVFRAWDEKLGRTVAVKVFTAAESNADDTARRLREMRLLAAANHPHLVTLFDAELPTALVLRSGFLVMELVDGESLRRRIDRTGPDPQLARRVVAELSEALAYLHEQGIVHRDLKPENILIESTSGSTKLVDFGIAQFVGAERITTDGTVLGTAAYLSPEQVRGQAVGPASDVYALGLVVLECLTGRRVFPGPAVEAAIARVSTDAPIPAALPEQWRTLLQAMTARDPAARPSAASLVTLVAGLGVPPAVADDESTIAMTVPTAVTLAGPTMRFDAVPPTAAVPMDDLFAALADDADVVELDNGANVGDVGDDAIVPPDARRPRRREGIVVGSLGVLLIGSAALALSLNAGRHDADAASTPPVTPAPTVTVTTLVQPATTPAAQHISVPAPSPSVARVGTQTGTRTGGQPATTTGTSTSSTSSSTTPVGTKPSSTKPTTGTGTATGSGQSPTHGGGRHAGHANGKG